MSETLERLVVIVSIVSCDASIGRLYPVFAGVGRVSQLIGVSIVVMCVGVCNSCVDSCSVL